MEYNHILVAVDGSKGGQHAFEKAIEVAKRNNATLHIVHIIEMTTFANIGTLLTIATERMEEYGTNLLEEYKRIALESGVCVNTILESGDPKTIIPKKIAPAHNIDLIICGAQGLNKVEHFFIGSVSESISRHATCDILIVRN